MSGKRRGWLVVGLGSPHGDDQAGWQVIDRLQQHRLGSHVALRKAAVPHDLIDWCEEADVMHLVDAGRFPPAVPGVFAGGTLRFALESEPGSTGEPTFRVCDGEESRQAGLAAASVASARRVTSSHHADLLTLLQLARRLGRLPDRVVLWIVPGTCFDPGQPTSAECRKAVDACADRVAEELADA